MSVHTVADNKANQKLYLTIFLHSQYHRTISHQIQHSETLFTIQCCYLNWK